MFQVCPELKERIERFCTANVAALSVESLCNFVHETLMPETQALTCHLIRHPSANQWNTSVIAPT